MVQIDLSGIAFLLPVFAFLLVFIVSYGLLGKTKAIGGNNFVHLVVSFIIGVIFVVSANAVKFVENTTTWFVVFLVALMFVGLIVGLFGKMDDFLGKPAFVWTFVIIILLVFLFSGVYVFSDLFSKWFAGPKEFLLQPQILGVVVLVVLAIVASLIVTAKVKK